MKRAVLILSLVSMSIVAQANHQLSEVALKMFNNGFISVAVDNGPVSAIAAKHMLNNLPAGYRHIKVWKHKPYKKGAVLIVNEMVYVPAGVRMRAVIDEHRHLRIVETIAKECVSANTYNYNGGNCGTGHTVNNWGYGMSDYDFERLRATVALQSFDDTRLIIALQGVRGNYMSSRQVALLMREFTFEGTKLDFAKQAYSYVIDKANYFVVNNEFTFSSSIDELNQFLQG